MAMDLCYDKLTNAYTADVFYDLAKEYVGKEKYQGLLLVDIDDIAFLNRFYSRETGDLIIQRTVSNIFSVIPKGAIVGRAGGDEFFVFLPSLKGFSEIDKIAEKLVRLQNKPFMINNNPIVQTVSIGGIALTEEILEKYTLGDIFNLASCALLSAKDEGKNRYVKYNETYHKRYDRLMMIKSILKSPNLKDDIKIHYQPVYNMKSGELVAFEALCRLNRNIDGEITPTEFIKIAEESNLIWIIDKVVLNEVYNTLSGFKKRNIKIRVSVNISPKSFLNDEFMAEIDNLMKRGEIEEGALLIELTENTIVNNFDKAKEIIKKLNGYGISVMLDDFGSGYSNLVAVLNLDINIIKVDRALIENIGDYKNNVIFQKTVEIAKDFNIKVLAEGIETKSQYKELKKFECEMGQGFLFAKPMSLDAVYDYICSNKKINTLWECCL